jgi:hypothetical protein
MAKCTLSLAGHPVEPSLGKGEHHGTHNAGVRPPFLAHQSAPLCVVRTTNFLRPTRSQMRQAYRRNGDPVPVNLCGLFGRAWA